MIEEKGQCQLCDSLHVCVAFRFRVQVKMLCLKGPPKQVILVNLGNISKTESYGLENFRTGETKACLIII